MVYQISMLNKLQNCMMQTTTLWRYVGHRHCCLSAAIAKDVEIRSKRKYTGMNRLYSTDVDAPRNLFEVYERNSHWMGVYDRHPVTTAQLSTIELRQKVENEKQKQISINLPLFINPPKATWTSEAKRIGAVGIKIGMTHVWTKEGFSHAVSVVQIRDCHVLDTQVSREDGGIDRYTQMIVGACDITDEKFLAGMSYKKMSWYDERGIFPKQYWTGFKVTKDSLLLPGTEITAKHFQPGQYVNVYGVSTKKGFQGVMKRWGMKGQPASHGQSKTHRKMGATGGGQDPGRIFPGKRMAGHVGGKRRSTPPLKLMRINTKYNVLFIKGTIPGSVGSFVKIADGRNREFPNAPPPFPTYFGSGEEEMLDEDLCADNVCHMQDSSLEFPPYKL